MKRIFLLLGLLALVSPAWGIDFGYVTISDYLRFPVIAVDDTGMVARPDSGAVIVWFEGEAGTDTSSYTYVWTTGGATDAVIDSLHLVDTDVWYFVDVVADIDDGQGVGNYTGTVILYADDQPFYNNFSFILDTTETEALPEKYTDVNWDEILIGATHNVQNSAGKRLRAVASDVISTGTAQVSGTPTSPGTYIILAATESEADDFYNGHIVKIIVGTGLHQQRLIEDYTGAADSVALHVGEDWTINPDATSVYEIIGGFAVEITHIHDWAVGNIFNYTHGSDFVGYGDSTTNKPVGYWIKIAGDSANIASLSDILIPFTLLEGSKGFTNYSGEEDTIFISEDGTDTTSIIIYYHPSGVAGQRPDSVKMINWIPE